MIKKHGGKTSYYIIRGSYDYIIYQYKFFGRDIIFSVFPPPEEFGTPYDCIALFKIKNK